MTIQVRYNGIWFSTGNVYQYKRTRDEEGYEKIFFQTFKGRFFCMVPVDYREIPVRDLRDADRYICTRISKAEYDALDAAVNEPLWQEVVYAS